MTNPITFIQHKLDQIAMYRTVTLALLFLVVVSLGMSLTPLLSYGFLELLGSLVLCVLLALITNLVFAVPLKIPANHESALITGLILFFLFLPPANLEQTVWLGIAVIVGVASKFILAYKKQHIFNAAALGAVAVSAVYVDGVPLLEAYWWIGTPPLFIPLLLAGAAVVAKIRKWTPVIAFLLVAYVVFVVEQFRLDVGDTIFSATETFLLSWPALFLAFFMLTEPFTLPGTKKKQIAYGALVGFLSSTTIFTGLINMTPELALVIGNAVFFPLTLRQKLYLELKEKQLVAERTWEYIFKKPAGMNYKAGQYLEWTVPHSKQDNRGQRRYFTIASAPEEEDLRLALRVEAEGGSTYKSALQELEIGDSIIASQRAGDFLLPPDPGTKVAMIAGGIGVTPFLSHLSHLSLTEKETDSVLYYCNNTEAEIAYLDTFRHYENTMNFRLVNALAKEDKPGFETGFLNKEIIARHTPDYQDRVWYLSGPPAMVNSYKKLLLAMGVKRSQIKQDFFPGLA
jgi:ferredoxin-NADP reductase